MKVIFRKFTDGDIIALFPTESADWCAHNCSSYMHIGQHGTASTGIVSNTKPTKPHEYADLLAELKDIGYEDLIIAKRFTESDYTARQSQI